MSICPKCGGATISGPVFVGNSLSIKGGEALRYRCVKCGYTKDRPTKDAK